MLSRLVISIAVATLLFSGASRADEASDWHLLTKSAGGTVTLLKDLTKRECEFARARMKGQPATDEERAHETASMMAEAKRMQYFADKTGCTWRGGTTRIGQMQSIGHKGEECMFGGDMSGTASSGFIVLQPGDIEYAECFR